MEMKWAGYGTTWNKKDVAGPEILASKGKRGGNRWCSSGQNSKKQRDANDSSAVDLADLCSQQTSATNKLYFKPPYEELYRCLWREGFKNVKGNAIDGNEVPWNCESVAYLGIFNNTGGNIMSFKARGKGAAVIVVEDDKYLWHSKTILNM